MLEYILKQKGIEDIEELTFPIAIPTVNLKNGEITYFSNIDIENKDNVYDIYTDRWCLVEENTNYEDEPKNVKGGKLASIVRASCSVPGIFVPKRINDEIYIDGGVRVNSPIDVLRKMGADKVIVITFNCNKGNYLGIENVIGISSQAFNIMSHESNKDKVEFADVNVRLCLNDVSLLDFSNANSIAIRGYNIIANNIDRIKKSLGIKEEQG
jgi:NTE family protein